MVLILTTVLSLVTISTGFGNIFSLLKIKVEPFYIHFPTIMSEFGYKWVIKINNSLYVKVHAHKIWHAKLQGGIESIFSSLTNHKPVSSYLRS